MDGGIIALIRMSEMPSQLARQVAVPESKRVKPLAKSCFCRPVLACLHTISVVSLRRTLRLASAAHNHRRRYGTLPSTIPSRRHTHPHLSSPRPAKLHRKPLPLLRLNAIEVHLAQQPEGQDDPEGESGGEGGDPVDHICIVTEELVGW